MTQAVRLMGSGAAAQLARNIVGSVANTLSATGSSSQANSYAVTEDVSVFTTAASNSGARLPSTSTPGDTFVIVNGDANTMLIYPPSGGKLNVGTQDASVSLLTKQAALCISIDGTSYAVVYNT